MEIKTGFLPKQINLNEMSDITVKIVLLGDGMSGKTQLLLTFGKMILEYLRRIHKDFREYEAKNKQSMAFINWAKKSGFLIEYGDFSWNLSSISLKTETIGIEDFHFKFPYFWDNSTYRITIKGNDLGGQNIFDHFRAVLGKIAKPGDNMIVVFDKTRKFSCYNSIEHITEVLGRSGSEKEDGKKNDIQFWYVGNKIDLEHHVRANFWRDGVIESFLRSTNSKMLSYQIPSLLDVGEEKSISYVIKNNRIPFPDLEALIFNAIRHFDEKYSTPLMSEVNTKALAREIATQLFFSQLSEKSEGKENLYQTKEWKNFKDVIFKERPLALQYLRGMSVLQKQNDFNDIYERIRSNWIGYGVDFPVTYDKMVRALTKAGEANDILKEMSNNFATNAISGAGVTDLFDSIISKAILASKKPIIKRTNKVRRKFISKF